jgi:hypothetical protein
MDAFVRRYIHENLSYRFVMLPDGAAAYAVEAASRTANGSMVVPCLTQEGKQWRHLSSISEISS